MLSKSKARIFKRWHYIMWKVTQHCHVKFGKRRCNFIETICGYLKNNCFRWRGGGAEALHRGALSINASTGIFEEFWSTHNRKVEDDRPFSASCIRLSENRTMNDVCLNHSHVACNLFHEFLK